MQGAGRCASVGRVAVYEPLVVINEADGDVPTPESLGRLLRARAGRSAPARTLWCGWYRVGGWFELGWTVDPRCGARAVGMRRSVFVYQNEDSSIENEDSSIEKR